MIGKLMTRKEKGRRRGTKTAKPSRFLLYAAPPPVMLGLLWIVFRGTRYSQHSEASNSTVPAALSNGHHCRELFEASLLEAEVQLVSDQLNTCGFAYITPGLVDAGWRSEAHGFLEHQWADAAFRQQHTRRVPAGARRIDIVPGSAVQGPFNGSTMAAAFDASLFRLLQHNLGSRSPAAAPPRADRHTAADECVAWARLGLCDTDPPRMLERCATTCANEARALCCDLAMALVVNAQRQSHDPAIDIKPQTWHEDSMPDPIGVRGLNELYVIVALHDVESGLIAVQPGCFGGKSGDADDRPCARSAGYAPSRMAAGSMLLHKPKLRHRGLWQTGPHDDRFLLSLDVIQRGTGWRHYFDRTQHGANGRYAQAHGDRRAAFGERLRVAVEQHLL